ncbi:hypothetical protein PFISCL1PPCAC_8867, partial [Pristionchus fissidentatus]
SQACRQLRQFDLDIGRRQFNRVTMEFGLSDVNFHNIEAHYTRLFKNAFVTYFTIECFHFDERAVRIVSGIFSSISYQ